jgi:hypothetical protein
MFQQDFTGNEGLTHYISVKFFEELLAKSCLHLRRQDLQEKDSEDGIFPSANKTQMHAFDLGLMRALGSSEKSARDLATNYQQGNDSVMRMRHYLHCWTLRDDESKWMWETHGYRGAGICIKTTVRRLCEAVGSNTFIGHNQKPFDLKIGPARYIGDDEPAPTWPSYMVAFRKTKKQEHQNEAEARLLACDMDIESPIGPECQLVPVNFDRLFHAVYLGSQVTKEDYERVEARTNELAGSRVVRPSQIRF